MTFKRKLYLKRMIFFLAAGFVIFLHGCNFQSSDTCKKSPLIKTEEMDPGNAIKLFNGKNLNNFYIFLQNRGRNNDPKKVFTIQDGTIRISGEEWGCLTTKEEYGNYHLTVEFKWGEQTFAPRIENARDSGLVIHSQGEDGAFGKTWMYGIELQMIEGGTGDFIVVADGHETFDIFLTCLAAETDMYMRNPAHPKPSVAVASTGGDATRTGRTSRASAENRMSKNRSANGIDTNVSLTDKPLRSF